MKILFTLSNLAPPVGRRRRQRTIFSKKQVTILEQVFEKSPYPDIQLRDELSQRLDIPEARIQVKSHPILLFRKYFFFRSGLKIVVVVLAHHSNVQLNPRTFCILVKKFVNK